MDVNYISTISTVYYGFYCHSNDFMGSTVTIMSVMGSTVVLLYFYYLDGFYCPSTVYCGVYCFYGFYCISTVYYGFYCHSTVYCVFYCHSTVYFGFYCLWLLLSLYCLYGFYCHSTTYWFFCLLSLYSLLTVTLLALLPL